MVARQVEAQKNTGAKCKFDKSVELILLLPRYFTSRAMVPSLENSIQSLWERQLKSDGK